jgi:hypothetical protein
MVEGGRPIDDRGRTHARQLLFFTVRQNIQYDHPTLMVLALALVCENMCPRLKKNSHKLRDYWPHGLLKTQLQVAGDGVQMKLMLVPGR